MKDYKRIGSETFDMVKFVVNGTGFQWKIFHGVSLLLHESSWDTEETDHYDLSGVLIFENEAFEEGNCSNSVFIVSSNQWYKLYFCQVAAEDIWIDWKTPDITYSAIQNESTTTFYYRIKSDVGQWIRNRSLPCKAKEIYEKNKQWERDYNIQKEQNIIESRKFFKEMFDIDEINLKFLGL